MLDLLVVVRIVHFAATIAAAGVVYFRLFVAEPVFATEANNLGPGIKRLRSQWLRVEWVSITIAILSGMLWLVLLASNIYDTPITEVVRDGGVWTVATETHFGRIWLVRLSLAVLLALSVAVPMAATIPPRWNFLPFILATGFLVILAWVGHAGATPGPAGQFHLAADILHLAAVGAWIGGLPPLIMLLSSARSSNEKDWARLITAAVPRFSFVGVASVCVLLGSGIINSWYLVGSINNLTETAYGRLVLAKLCLFVIMVGIATFNRFQLTAELPAAEAMRKLQRNSMAETALGLAALAVVGLLGTMAPAVHAHHHISNAVIPADAAFVHIHSEQGMADVTIEPGHSGPARATIRLWNEDFSPLGAQEITFTLVAPKSGSKSTRYGALLDSEGAWHVDGIELSEPGNWTVAVDALLDRGRHLVLDAPIVIERK